MPSSSAPIFPGIHITEKEFSCPCCDRLPPDLRKDIKYSYFASFIKWERIREHWGKPIIIGKGGGYRCPRYQYNLIIKRKTNASTSAHSFWALDNDMDNERETERFAKLAMELFPEMRIIYKCYLERGQTFVHIDEGYLVEPRPSDSWVREFRL